ncbi:ADP-ribosyltransferase [Streptomyces erythrochromogenes]|uniref:ADP-ribosyltransferase n=1 Tax=Streptomyces erythrochromogenes TaxID=285574 RepID=UPI00344324CC
MCQSKTAGGRRCVSSHPAVRAARKALPPRLAELLAASEDQAAHTAYADAVQAAAKAREAADAGEDELAAAYAKQAREDAQLAQQRLAGNSETNAGLIGGTPPPGAPEHVRSAYALAKATGNDQAVLIPGPGDQQTVAWDEDGYAGAVTIHPSPDDDTRPTARVTLTDLDRNRYEALAKSPWDYRTEHGQVIYDRVPADVAEEILHTARTGAPAKPWRKHGLTAGKNRDALDDDDIHRLHRESYAWAAELDDDQHAWLEGYCDDDYEPINHHLYTGADLDDPPKGLSASAREITEHLDSAIACAPEPEDPHITYRGYTPPEAIRAADNVVPWVQENFRIGQDYRDDSYMSTSHCPEVAAGTFAETEFRGPDGTLGKASHGVVFEVVSRHGAAVTALSHDETEYERLMPRNATYRVVGIHDNVIIDRNRCVVVQMVHLDEIPRH